MVCNNYQKNNLMSVLFRPQFQGRKWLRQFYGHLGFWVLILQELSMPTNSHFRGGGYFVFFLGGEERGAVFFVYGRGEFSEIVPNAS